MPTLSLNQEALAVGLDEAMEDHGLDCHADYSLGVFSDNGARAVKELAALAFDDWGALDQPEGSEVDVCVYALDVEYENSLLITVRSRIGPGIQLATLTVDAHKLADDIYERRGPAVLAEILEGVLFYANRLLENAGDVLNAPSLPTA